MISIAIPIYDMKNGDWFLSRLLNSLQKQTFRDFEIVIAKTGGSMGHNINEAIKRCKGDLIKILLQDDYLAHKDSLRVISSSFEGEWLASGCLHDDGTNIFNPHYPVYSSSSNTMGSPSVITIKNGLDVFFDEKMEWLVDLDFYRRLYIKYGEPTLLNDLNICIGLGDHQTTNILTNAQKEAEVEYLKNKHD